MSLDDDWFPDIFSESKTTTENKKTEQPHKKPTVSLKPHRKVVLRKFPGPAGIPMPPNSDSNILNSSSNEITCTQRSMSMFEDGPWEEMIKDFGSNQLPVRYNIKWIKTKATLNQLTNWKAPFLAAIVQAVECSESINVILKDMTGEIQAAVIQNLYEEHSDNFKVGSVIILKHFGVLTTGQSRNHYLTITSKNLVCIYAKQESDEECSVRKIELQSFDSSSFTDTPSSNALENFEDDFQIPDDFEENALRDIEWRDSQQRSSPQTVPKDIGMFERGCLHRTPRNNSLHALSGDSGLKIPNVPKVSGDNNRRVSGDYTNHNRVSAEISLQKITNDASRKVYSDSGDFKDNNSKRQNELNAFEDGDLSFTQISTDLDHGTSPKKFKFRPLKKDKPQDVIVTCSQVTVKTSAEHSGIWKSALEDVDEDALLGDF